METSEPNLAHVAPGGASQGPEKGVSRSDLESGAYVDLYLNSDMAHNVWSEERRTRSLTETLALRPSPGPLWVFGYGSLIWNPCFRYEEKKAVTLYGWNRRFCIQSISGRGTSERPGRVMALRPGGAVEGIAFRLPKAEVARELRLIWRREMVGGVYRPLWLPAISVNGEKMMTLSFAADESHPLFIGFEPLLETATAIRMAVGGLGTNAHYLFELRDSLAEHAQSDTYVSLLAAFVQWIV